MQLNIFQPVSPTCLNTDVFSYKSMILIFKSNYETYIKFLLYSQRCVFLLFKYVYDVLLFCYVSVCVRP